jgi:hypothetical protein
MVRNNRMRWFAAMGAAGMARQADTAETGRDSKITLSA